MNKIIINNKEYEYEIKYKKMKSIYIRVIDKHIVVSAPKYTKVKDIENIILKDKDQILKMLDDYKLYIDTTLNYAYLFGIKYHLIVRDLNIYKCSIHGNDLYVYHSNVIKCIEEYGLSLLKEYVNKKMQEYLSLYFNFKMPTLVFKRYKARWGSCYYKVNKISFNISLMYLDYKLIDYVIMHELCHFIEANHSSKFYNELRKRMPDYREREILLKGMHV